VSTVVSATRSVVGRPGRRVEVRRCGRADRDTPVRDTL